MGTEDGFPAGFPDGCSDGLAEGGVVSPRPPPAAEGVEPALLTDVAVFASTGVEPTLLADDAVFAAAGAESALLEDVVVFAAVSLADDGSPAGAWVVVWLEDVPDVLVAETPPGLSDGLSCPVEPETVV